jgi:ATP-dependent helicase/nuclease subunit B
MSVFIDALADLCKENLLTEKWLIIPNLRIGYQIMDRITLSGQGLINLRIKTINRLAKDIVDASLPGETGRHLQPLHQELLMGELFGALQAQGMGYLSELTPGPGLFSHLLKTMIELRKANIHHTQLAIEYFDESIKGMEIVFLLREYEKKLASLGKLDYPGTVRRAIECIDAGLYRHDRDILIVLGKDLIEYDLCILEKNLIQAFPPDQVKLLPYDEPEKRAETHETDLSLLGAVLNPFQAPLPGKDGTIEFYRSYGMVNEVKEVFRRVLKRGIPFDQVEILHTDVSSYVDLIFETAYQFTGDNPSGMPVTFSDGIPVSHFRPARALRGWISWIRGGFSQHHVRRMIHDGLFTIGESGDLDLHFSRLSGYFRQIGIGQGKDRYTPALEQAVRECEEQLISIAPLAGENDREFGIRNQKCAQKLLYYKELRRFFLELCENTPETGSELAYIIEKALWFMEHSARGTSELDNYTAQLLRKRIYELKEYSDRGVIGPDFDIWNWLSRLVQETRVYGHGPREGHLYVSSLYNGGYSGREYTFVLGLDDTRFPGSGFHDPILLDQERAGISPHIPRTADIPGNRLKDISRLFGRLRGRVTLSYSTMDIPKNRELFPSPVFLSAYRIASGNHDADYEALEHALGSPVSFSPAHQADAATPDEWWLHMLCKNGYQHDKGKGEAMRTEDKGPGDGIISLLGKMYPHLSAGLVAKKMRESSAFTVFDGFVPMAGKGMNPYKKDGPVLSANSLQLLARSPADYFFKYVLGLKPPEDEETDRNLWLTHLDRGSMLHRVFETCMRKLRERGELPSYARHRGFFHGALSREINKIREMNPPVSPFVYEQDCFYLEKAVDIFLSKEEQFCKTSTPLYFEVPVGIPDKPDSDGPGSPDPVSVHLPNNKSIRVRAQIDRIDKIGKEDQPWYAVWDYKSGSSTFYEENGPFGQGRIIQHVLYLLIVEKLLREKVADNAEVREVGFFFPTLEKEGLGKRIYWPSSLLFPGSKYLVFLSDMLTEGSFPCSNSPDDMIFTEYADAFIDYEHAVSDMERKLKNQRNTHLHTMRVLRE